LKSNGHFYYNIGHAGSTDSQLDDLFGGVKRPNVTDRIQNVYYSFEL